MTTEQEIKFDHTCTCGTEDGDDDHSTMCDLWNCNEWFEGKATWYKGQLWDGEELWGWGNDEETTEVKLTDTVTNLAKKFVAKDKDLIDDELDDDELYWCDCFAEDDETVEWTTKHQATCLLQEHEEWVGGYCEWDHPTRTFIYYDDLEPGDKTKGSLSYGSGWDSYYGAGGTTGFKKSCTHDGTKAVEFPDGTKVYPSSSYDTKNRESVPDFALYLEVSRQPYSVATYIPWKDYGLPAVNFHAAANTIIETFATAKSGLTVEVGCIGAHGRTGTVLACMAILGGVHPDDAVHWVKKNHCDSAVEGEKQVWFVEWFAAYISGTAAPPPPPEPPPLPPVKKGEWTQGTLTGVAHVGPPPTPQVGSNKGDLVKGDPCPACKKNTIMIGGTKGNRLACNTKECANYDGLPQCDTCKVCLDAHPLGGYLCWNLHCTQFHIKADSPAAGKQSWKKGRKKKKKTGGDST